MKCPNGNEAGKSDLCSQICDFSFLSIQDTVVQVQQFSFQKGIFPRACEPGPLFLPSVWWGWAEIRGEGWGRRETCIPEAPPLSAHPLSHLILKTVMSL